MVEDKSIEKMYIDSAGKLRACLPKFIIFLGFAYIIWFIGTTYFIPVSRGVFIGAIEATRLDSVLILVVVLVFITASFLEITHVADACAGLSLAYMTHNEDTVNHVRFRKMRRAFRTVLYIIPFGVAFLIFGNLLNQINTLFSTVIPIVIVIWLVVGSVLLAMVLGVELEETAKAFSEKMRKKKAQKPS